MKSAFALIGILALLFASTASADPGDTLWTRAYGTEGYDYGCCVQHTIDGGFIAVGYTCPYIGGQNDIYLVKTSADGDTMWTRTYGGDGSDLCRAIRQLPDGGYILGAYTASFGAGGFDVWLIRTDADGDTLWTRTYGGPRNDQFFSIEPTNDGGYIGVGLTDTSTVIYDDQLWLVKTDAGGAEEWSKIYGGFGAENDDLGWEVQQTADGGYIVVGTTRSFGPGSQDIWLLKTDSNGDTTWTKTFGGLSNDVGLSVHQTLDEGYIVAGHTQSFGAGSRDFYLIRTQPNGDSLWTRAYGGTSEDIGYSVRQTPDGGYAFAGYTRSFGAGGSDVWLLKIAANGDTLWTRTSVAPATNKRILWIWSVRRDI